MSLRHQNLKRRRYFIRNGRTWRDGSRTTFYPDGQLRSYETKDYIDAMKGVKIVDFYEDNI